jgi:hypothetical protein
LSVPSTWRHLEPHGAAVAPLAQQVRDLPGHLIILVEIGAEDADKEWRDLARQRFADALGEHRVNLHQLVRKLIEHGTDFRLQLRGRRRTRGVELDLELALIRRIGVLAVLGAADLLGDALDPGNCCESLRNALADA